MLASRTASGKTSAFGQQSSCLRDEHEAVLHGDAEQPNQPDERRDVPCLPGNQQRQNAADEGDRDGAQNHAGLDRRTERDEEQDEHAKERRPDRERQGARRSGLALHPAAEVKEVAGWQLQLISQNASDVGCGAAEIPAAHRCLNRDATRARFAADRGRTKRLRHVSELSQRNARAVVAIDQQRPNRIERVPPIVPKPHDEVEASLPDPDLRPLFAHETDPHRSNHVAWRQPDARGRLPIHRDLELWQSRELLGAKVRQPVNASDERLGLLGEPRELVEIRAEDPNGDVGRRARRALHRCASRAAS